MNRESIQRLNQLNTHFYQRTASSFASTRHNSWPGWKPFVDRIQKDPSFLHRSPSLRVVDLACGNLRFEAYLENQIPDAAFSFITVDNCTSFPEMPLRSPVDFHNVNIIDALLDNRLQACIQDRVRKTNASPFADVVVSFGFAHHIPSEMLRKRFMESLVNTIRPGGYACISFWNFLQEESLSHKAQITTAQALEQLDLEGLEQGDCILGWQNDPNAYRYCHSFCEEEIDDLIERLSDTISLTDRYSADGRNGNLNTYLIMQKRERYNYPVL